MGNLGFTDETRAKLRAAWTPERKEKNRLAMLGNTRGLIAGRKNRGKKRTDAEKKAIGDRMRGKTWKNGLEHRINSSAAKMGANNPMWRGGKTSEKRLLRDRIETRLWRESVFDRDNYTCGICLVRGGKLEAHHIAPVSVEPGKRYDKDNGMTLCASCHRRITTIHHQIGIYRAGAEAFVLQSNTE